MATCLSRIVLDANDPYALAGFWATALDWEIGKPEGAYLPVRARLAPQDQPWGLVLQELRDSTSGQGRIHLDLRSGSRDEQTATVEQLISCGATPADVGQGDVPWVVLADPEGNRFCVLEPREAYRDAKRLAAIVVSARDPQRLSAFWADAAGWPVIGEEPDVVALGAPELPGRPLLEFVRSDGEKPSKNRLHLDVAPWPGADRDEEVDRLIELGASHVDIGQGGVPWVVLADPEGNEFCVLPPREKGSAC